MDIVALLSPVAATKSAEGGVGGPSKKAAGDAFAGVFAEAIAKTADGASIVPGATPANAAVSTIGASPSAVPVPALATPAVAAVPSPSLMTSDDVKKENPSGAEGNVLPAGPKNAKIDRTTDSPTLYSEAPSVAVETTVAAPEIPAAANAETVPSEDSANAAPKPVVSTRSGSRSKARKVDAPPDPPPPTATPEKGATTKAPNAPVEQPDPNSERSSTPNESSIDEAKPSLTDVPVAIVPFVPVVASLIPSANSPKASVTSPVEAMSVVATATATPTAVPDTAAVTTLKSARSRPESRGKASVTTANDATVKVSDTASDESADAAAISAPSPIATPSVPTAATGVAADDVAPTVSTAPTLAAAPDLGVVPQVVQVNADAAAVALPAAVAPASSVPNAQVAKVAADRSVGKAVAASPKTPDAPVKSAATTKDVPAAFVLDSAPTMSGDDAPSEDAPSQDAPQDPTVQSSAAPTARTAATERPDAGTDRPSVDRHLVVRQVAERIENLVASRPKDGVVVHLEPRDLGTVTLVVKGLQGALDVQVSASDDRVRESLNSSRPELAQALAPRGIELRELRVSTAPASTTSSSTSNGSNPNGGNPNSNSEGRPQSPSSSPTLVKASSAETSAPRSARSTGRGVDLLV